MQSFPSLLRRYSQDLSTGKSTLQHAPAGNDVQMMRQISEKSVKTLRPGSLSEQDCHNLLRIGEILFFHPTRFSRTLAAELDLPQEELVRLFRIIRNIKPIQDLLTFESPLRRRVSFLRRELLPENRPMLKAMFTGEVCQPCHVEFHPALMCNLRCRACPGVFSRGPGRTA